MLLLNSILLLFLLNTLAYSELICEVEYSKVYQTQNIIKWENKKYVPNEVITSKPFCLNSNGTLITRTCLNGKWYPTETPYCYDIKFKNTSKSNNLSQPKKLSLDLKSNVNIIKKFSQQFETNLHYVNYDESFLMSSDEECLLYNLHINNTITSNCSNLYDTMYNTQKMEYNCPDNCKPISNFRCCCKKFGNCTNLVTVNYENLNILTKLVKNDICLVENKFNSSTTYLNGSNWQYGPINTRCSICYKNLLNARQPELILSFEKRKQKLYLLVYSSYMILKNKELAIYCFTNAGYSVNKLVKIEKIYYHFYEDDTSFLLLDSIHVFRVKLEKYMGMYKCEAFTINNQTIRSNTIVAFKQKYGNEYALRISFNNICIFTCQNSKWNKKIREYFINILYPFAAEVRIMNIFKFDIFENLFDILLHISSAKNISIVKEFTIFKQKLSKIDKNINVIYFRNSEFCLPNIFKDLSWPLTEIEMKTVSQNFCLAEDYTPATRKCSGNFLEGAIWEQTISGHCVKNTPISETTKTLQTILDTDKINETQFNKMWKQIISHQELTILDLYYFANLLSRVALFQNATIYAMDFVNLILGTNNFLLEKSQNVLNITDTILFAIDNILSNSFQFETPFLIQNDRCLLFVVNPFLTNISGLLLYNSEFTSLKNAQISSFYRNDSLNNINFANLKLAIQVPEIVLHQILNDTTDISSVFIIIIIYSNDNLFVNEEYKSTNYVISVNIPGFGSYLESPISILFQYVGNSPKMCGFWDNGERTRRRNGQWSNLGSSYLGKYENTTLHSCAYVHLSHFALLIMSDRTEISDDDNLISTLPENIYDDFYLEIITIIGGLCSCLGIIGIFLTALIFKKWRSKTGTKLLLHLSTTIFLESICIHLNEITFLKSTENMCKVIGMILHYVELSKFSWMLIYAYLQYLRFVKVLNPKPNNLILKSVIIGWGVPLAVVFTVGILTNESYVSNTFEFCYPRGTVLYVTVLLPILIIIIANLFIFAIVMYSVTYVKVRNNTKGQRKMRIYLALLLFFALGVPWVFGIAGALISDSVAKVVLFYIFCISGTYQGFVLFLFYVILNKEVLQYWVLYIKNKFYNS